MLVQSVLLLSVCIQLFRPTLTTAHQNNSVITGTKQRQNLKAKVATHLNGAGKPLSQSFVGYPFVKIDEKPSKRNLPIERRYGIAEGDDEMTYNENEPVKQGRSEKETDAESNFDEEALEKDYTVMNEEKLEEPSKQGSYTRETKFPDKLAGMVKHWVKGWNSADDGREASSERVFVGPLGKMTGRVRERVKVGETEIQGEQQGQRMITEGQGEVREEMRETFGILEEDEVNGRERVEVGSDRMNSEVEGGMKEEGEIKGRDRERAKVDSGLMGTREGEVNERDRKQVRVGSEVVMRNEGQMEDKVIRERVRMEDDITSEKIVMEKYGKMTERMGERAKVADAKVNNEREGMVIGNNDGSKGITRERTESKSNRLTKESEHRVTMVGNKGEVEQEKMREQENIKEMEKERLMIEKQNKIKKHISEIKKLINIVKKLQRESEEAMSEKNIKKTIN